MQPLVRAAAFAALLAAIGALGKTPKAPPPEPKAAPSAAFAPTLAASCGAGKLPEGDACIPLPKPGQTGFSGDLEADDPGLDVARHELVPRRPERPIDASSYRFPLATNPTVLGGLGKPLEGTADLPPNAAGPGLVLLSAARGDEVVALSLEGQEGPPEVVFVGELVGETVVTAHL